MERWLAADRDQANLTAVPMAVITSTFTPGAVTTCRLTPCRVGLCHSARR